MKKSILIICILISLAGSLFSQRDYKSVVLFDLAVKSQIPDWLGYYKYKNDSLRKVKLELVDTLDFSSLDYTDIPNNDYYLQDFINQCINLKYLNTITYQKRKIINFVRTDSLKFLEDYIVDFVCWYPDKFVKLDLYNKITGIRLLSTRLTEIPEYIFKFPELKYLDLSYFDNDELVYSGDWSYQKTLSNISEITKLKNLEFLDLTNCKIDTFPLEICELSNLKHLTIRTGFPVECIWSIPKEIVNLKKLEELNLSFSGFEVFPQEILKLTNLKILNLTVNEIGIIPKDISKLKNLTELYLAGNWNLIEPQNLSQLGELTKLTKLDLNYRIPKDLNFLTGLSNLQYLNLSEIYFLSFPKEILSLENLEYLNLSNSNIRNIPNEIADLKNLTYLNLHGNDSLDIYNLFDVFKDFDKEILISNYEYQENTDTSKLLIIIPEVSKLPANLPEIKKLSNLNLSYLDLGSSMLDILTVFPAIKNFKKEIWISTTYRIENNYFEFSEFLGYNINEDTSKLLIILPRLKSFPKEIGDIENITNIDFSDSHNSLSELPVELFNLVNLKTLNLKNNNLTEIPVEMEKLVNLETLNIENNKIYNVSNELCFFLSSLKDFKYDRQLDLFCNPEAKTKLDLSTTHLVKLGEEIKYFTNLQILDLSNNQLSEFSIEICSLKTINSLNLCNNQIDTIPNEIGNLTNLTYLNLRNNQISKLPKEIGNLYKLTSLDLSGNNITEIPAEIDCLENLTELQLKGNELVKIPPEIGNLYNLTTLDLGFNQLTEIPKEIGKLKNLQSLSLIENKLENLPKEFWNLKKLKVLDLSNNNFKELPVSINLIYLDELYLLGNDSLDFVKFCKTFQHYIWSLSIGTSRNIDIEYNLLTIYFPPVDSIPSEINNFPGLKYLTLSGSFTTLPKEIGQLPELKYLNLKGNLKSLPNEFGNLTNLKELFLGGNQLNLLPKEIGNLNNLYYLILNENQITEIPNEIGNLTKITTLSLSNNQLTELPCEIGQLFNLETLYLSDNLLISIPKEFGNLNNLKTIYLNNNQLTTLPEEIKNLAKLGYLNLSGNNFSEEEKQKIISWFEGKSCNIIW